VKQRCISPSGRFQTSRERPPMKLWHHGPDCKPGDPGEPEPLPLSRPRPRPKPKPVPVAG
jgi:hypothetical protein